MRISTACRECRVRKRRCIVSAHDIRCTLCVAKDLKCTGSVKSCPSDNNVYVSLAPAAGNPDPLPVSHVSPSQFSLAGELVADRTARLGNNDELRDELVDLYFELLHDKQHTLFHQSTFRAQLRDGEVSQYLSLAMMALVARFSTNPYFNDIKPRDRGRIWAAQSKKSFDSRKIAVSVAAIQGCALLGNLAFIEGDAAMESLYAAQAIRMVQILDLPRRLSTDDILREVEIRVWWNTWMMDTWTSASMGVPRQLITEPDYETPMEEVSFNKLGQIRASPADYEGHERSDPPREYGLWTQMIPLTITMGEIHILNKKTVSSVASYRQILEEVKQLSFKLDYWLSSLPMCLQNTVENLQLYARQGIGRTFAALHFGYHYHAQLLYYQFLHRATDSHPTQDTIRPDHGTANLLILARKYAARCKEHASALSKLMWTTNTTPGLECLWPINGHLLVIASSVHLHTILFEENEDLLAEARCMLEHNFMMLQQMQKYWPCLEFSTSRLHAFHRACQNSTRETFDMDGWMLHFLQEYALPVSERFEDVEKQAGPTPEAEPQVQVSELHYELVAADPTRGGLGALLHEVS